MLENRQENQQKCFRIRLFQGISRKFQSLRDLSPFLRRSLFIHSLTTQFSSCEPADYEDAKWNA